MVFLHDVCNRVATYFAYLCNLNDQPSLHILHMAGNLHDVAVDRSDAPPSLRARVRGVRAVPARDGRRHRDGAGGEPLARGIRPRLMPRPPATQVHHQQKRGEEHSPPYRRRQPISCRHTALRAPSVRTGIHHRCRLAAHSLNAPPEGVGGIEEKRTSRLLVFFPHKQNSWRITLEVSSSRSTHKRLTDWHGGAELPLDTQAPNSLFFQVSSRSSTPPEQSFNNIGGGGAPSPS